MLHLSAQPRRFYIASIILSLMMLLGFSISPAMATPVATTPTVASSALPAAVSGPTLKHGIVATEVRTLQVALSRNYRAKYFQLSYFTTTFGDVTYAGLVNWQMAAGYAPNGVIVAGSAQWQQLIREQLSPTKMHLQGVYLSHFYSSVQTRHEAWVSLSDNRVYILRNGSVTHSFAARFGRPWQGYHTPTGVYWVGRKLPMDYSRPFNNAKMPWSAYFNGGIAFHESSDFTQNGYAGWSHGCVNLKNGDAKKVYDALPIGSRVVVYRGGIQKQNMGRWK